MTILHLVLGSYTNSKTQNILGLIILAITIFLGAKGILINNNNTEGEDEITVAKEELG